MSIATASAILDVIAPEFAGNADKNDHLALAALRTSSTKFGDKYNYAVALRAAHTLTLADPVYGSSSGAVKSRKEGDLSISYGSTKGVNGYLSQTSYGIELAGLIRANIGAFSLTGLQSIPST